MKTYIEHSSQADHFPWISAIQAAAKKTSLLSLRLSWKILVALALTVAVCDVNGQSAKKSAADSIPAPDTWTLGPNLPNPLVRAVGVYFPANGLFYAIGGRMSDSAGSDAVHPLEFNPTTNTWTLRASMYPDNQMNNMACGVLTVSGTPQIYCVGGSAAGATTATARVFSYNPITDTMTTLPSDNWPGDAAGTILPGGFAVLGNKLYIMGGFNINVAMTSQTWQFDPNQPAGSRWLQLQDYPAQRGYVPAAAIGSKIYTAGGSLWDGTTLQDTADSFVFDPAANTWSAIANIPRATAETRALNVNNKMWVLGGGRVAPNPSNEVDVYDRTTNTWSTTSSFVTPRRNFPAATDGSQVYLAGGYDNTGTGFVLSTEIFKVPTVVSAVSRKTHGAAGTFDIALPLSGSPGVECRVSGGNHTIVVTFANPVTVASASVSLGTGSVGSFTGSGTSQITINLTGVTNAQVIGVTLGNVNDGTVSGDVTIPMGVLAGDTNGNAAVSSSDISQTKALSGQAANGANFRSDVNVNGSISSSDISLVKSASGTSLP